MYVLYSVMKIGSMDNGLPLYNCKVDIASSIVSILSLQFSIYKLVPCVIFQLTVFRCSRAIHLELCALIFPAY